jgi:hypothetical protein
MTDVHRCILTTMGRRVTSIIKKWSIITEILTRSTVDVNFNITRKLHRDNGVFLHNFLRNRLWARVRTIFIKIGFIKDNIARVSSDILHPADWFEKNNGKTGGDRFGNVNSIIDQFMLSCVEEVEDFDRFVAVILKSIIPPFVHIANAETHHRIYGCRPMLLQYTVEVST